MKKILVNSQITKMGVLYHNSWIGMCIMLSILLMRPEEMAKVVNFRSWDDPTFVFIFLLASAMGSILNYSIFLCTMNNSALTTTVVGCLKNVLTAYLGMIFLKDYVFSLENFIGLNISIFGSLIYSWAEFRSFTKKTAGGSSRQNRGRRGNNDGKAEVCK